jgi:hypothetical protein
MVAMLLLLKLCLVPTLVAAVTLASRRWGLRVGGVLTGLPMVAGPTLCFYAIEQGNAFAASAARSALLGIVATAAFCVAYARSAAHVAWPVSVIAGWSAFALLAAATYGVRDLRGVGELLLASGALLIGRRLVPPPPALPGAVVPPRWDLGLRMLTSAAAVVLLTALAAWLGARLSGMLSAFPVVTLVLAVFTHAQRGAAAVRVFLRGLLRGLHGFALFCIALSVALGPLGWPLLPAVLAALAAQLVLQALMLWRTVSAPDARPAATAPAGLRSQRPTP